MRMNQAIFLPTKNMVRILMISFFMLAMPALVNAQGMPLIRNFSATEYGAHNRNFDISVADDGTVFVANFEGLLYYDRAQWRILHTPEISRITSLYSSPDKTLWVGGHDFYGRIQRSDNGSLFLQQMERSQVPVEVQHSDADSVFLEDVVQTLRINDDMMVRVRNAKGIEVTDNNGRLIYAINEDNGLCSDMVHEVDYDGHGLLWGATAHGVFCVELPSPYSYLLPKDELSGEVNAIAEFDGSMYVGSSNGLYVVKGQKAERIPSVNNVCWQLCTSNASMLAATSSGVFRIAHGGAVSRMTSNSATSVLADGDKVYVGEPDGVFLYRSGQSPQKVSDMPLVTQLSLDDQGRLQMRNVYGKSSVPLPEFAPAISVTDNMGISWKTDEVGKHLQAVKNGKHLADFDKLLFPLSDISLGVVYRQDDKLWVGADERIAVVSLNSSALDSLTAHPRLSFRQIVIQGDSVIWGGYGDMPKSLPDLDSDQHHLWFSFALSSAPLSGNTLYRYRLNDEPWSQWSERQQVEFLNLPYGSFILSVQAQLANGTLSKVASVSWMIKYPFFMRWYMVILYFIMLAALIYAAFRYRLVKLRKDKAKLEQVVRERTDEVARQKDELMRQEKMASVGKLTQGLIDRILNPMNYIINFSKMSNDLARDIRTNVDANKEVMDKADYDDTIDTLGMLSDNLGLIDQYGQNTSRILKAMEEMLKDRTTGYRDMNLLPVLRQDVNMIPAVFADDIQRYHIHTQFSLPDKPMMMNGNAELLSQTIMGLLTNAVYAVVRKAQKAAYDAIVSLTAETVNGRHVITIRDNGVGIEQTIIDKIFDPFFTTKTSDEASGIGLYLGREIIQNHKGDIYVRSEKDVFTEFTISLPSISVS